MVETKSSLFGDDFRVKEKAKIECGKEHFKAIAADESPVRYLIARTLEDVILTE